MPDPIDSLAEDVLRATGAHLEPPIRVEEIAKALGVNAIVDGPLFEDGRLERGVERTVIYTRAGSPLNRRRFTIAHEVGHLLAAEPGQPVVARRLLRGGEERFCDKFAAALLLPASWVRSEFAGQPQTLRSARQLAQKADVSLAAAVIRLHETCEWTRALLRWRRVDNNWRFASGVAVPWALQGHVRSAPTTGDYFAAHRRQHETRLELPLLIRDRVVAVPAQVSITKTSAIALVDLRRQLRRSGSPD